MGRSQDPQGRQKLELVENQLPMQDTPARLVRYRREHPSDQKDLLNAMVNGKDLRTGEGMRDELDIANMTTSLIAGHKTTFNLLSFTFAQLLKNPAAYKAAQSEVNTAFKRGKIKIEHTKNLRYVNTLLK